MYRNTGLSLVVTLHSVAILITFSKANMYCISSIHDYVFVFMFSSAEKLQRSLYGCNKIWPIWLQACSHKYTHNDGGIYFLAVSFLYGQICV